MSADVSAVAAEDGVGDGPPDLVEEVLDFLLEGEADYADCVAVFFFAYVATSVNLVVGDAGAAFCFYGGEEPGEFLVGEFCEARVYADESFAHWSFLAIWWYLSASSWSQPPGGMWRWVMSQRMSSMSCVVSGYGEAGYGSAVDAVEDLPYGHGFLLAMDMA
jgi:hypothetical protein